ncbi:unnamed protein product [Vitrella brassicaformis CCMP3155]|uniref:Uncharacterized protein n=1 Tax=Vitrella brassicaformis (strain CCMP3155) TaxID=1169540 RepID=A0A0G4EXN2_VITBC|nr:unnamed protein product [Vitrella brassicaformis CCMP3155]|mmetsp:Transcript_38954/g.97458  ORF Transcript_38954/g.97458 Transcript_38954/m.97458 type:complete len:183 (-) Transcript_38954:333-881(-)|eukprot:CEM04069.1 unnamed protein product [Vitrella brassicaformis CCMP3155]
MHISSVNCSPAPAKQNGSRPTLLPHLSSRYLLRRVLGVALWLYACEYLRRRKYGLSTRGILHRDLGELVALVRWFVNRSCSRLDAFDMALLTLVAYVAISRAVRAISALTPVVVHMRAAICRGVQQVQLMWTHVVTGDVERRPRFSSVEIFLHRPNGEERCLRARVQGYLRQRDDEHTPDGG